VGKTAKPNPEFLRTKEDQKMKTQKLFVIGAIVCLTVSVYFLTTDAVAGDEQENPARLSMPDFKSLVSEAMRLRVAKAEVAGAQEAGEGGPDFDLQECLSLSTAIFDIQAHFCKAPDGVIEVDCYIEAVLNLLQNTIRCTFWD